MGIVGLHAGIAVVEEVAYITQYFRIKVFAKMASLLDIVQQISFDGNHNGHRVVGHRKALASGELFIFLVKSKKTSSTSQL